MAFGVTSVGFVGKTFQEIKDSLETRFKEELGDQLDFAPQSVASQIVTIFAEYLADGWQVAQDVYSAADPDSAVGAALDAVAGITGTIREGETPSTVTLFVTGTNGTVLTTGRRVSIGATGVAFKTTASATLATASAWASSTAYAVGDIRRNGATQRVYLCITAGTSAGSGGPDAESTNITDGSVHWRFLGTGAAYAEVAAESEEVGPKVAEAYDIDTIETPVSGWQSVTNLLDATLGRIEEKDSELRIRREEELRAGGRSSVEAIRADVLQVEDVLQCTVFENDTDATDGDGLPPHSVETLVQGGAAADIAQAIFESKAAGIATYGTTTQSHTDTQGIAHSVKFTYVSEVTIWAALTVSIDSSLYPADGDAQIKTAIVAWGDQQKAGRNAVQNFIRAQALTVPGVLDVTVCLLGTANPPVTNGNITITSREIAVYDTSRIAITTVEGTP